MKVAKLVWGADDRTQMEVLHLSLQLTPEEDGRWTRSFPDHRRVNDVNVDAGPLLRCLFLDCLSIEDRIRILQESLAEAMNPDSISENQTKKRP